MSDSAGLRATLARSRMLRAGDKVGDRYVVIEQIAEGGMGTLWRAHHVELDVDVALKVLLVDRATPDLIKRFKREAQASARLRSPNIVTVLDYGVHDDRPYLAMELLRGEDLAARLASKKTLSLEDTAAIMQAVARAMQVAHAAEIVHRDLKPANIFLERVGEQEVVKVLDFGVAKDLRSKGDPSATTGAAVVGSPAYMSPEQVWAETVDHRADIWAMGVVMFEMLTGTCPFEDETLAKIFERIIRAPIPKIRDLNPALPPSLDAFFDKALARAPADRFASAKEMGDALLRALDPAASREPSPALAKTQLDLAPLSVGLPRAVSRRRAPLWLGLVAITVVGTGLALRLAVRSDSAPPREAPETRIVAPPPSALPTAAATAAATAIIDVAPGAAASAVRAAAPSGTARPVARTRPPSSIGGPTPVDPTFGVPVPP